MRKDYTDARFKVIKPGSRPSPQQEFAAEYADWNGWAKATYWIVLIAGSAAGFSLIWLVRSLAR